MASQMLTYILFKTKSMVLSATSRKSSQMPTYKLFKTQNMHLSAISRKGQPDADLQIVQNPHVLSATSKKGLPDTDLQPAQNPEHIFVSKKQEGLARCWLTFCSKPMSGSEDEYMQNINLHSVYNPSTFLLASSRDQLDVDLLSV